MSFWMYGLVAFIISLSVPCAFLLTVRFDFQNFIALLILLHTRITFLCSEQLQAVRLLLQNFFITSSKQNLIFKVKTLKGYIVLFHLKACL